MGADFVIAVHIDTEGEEEIEMKNGLDVEAVAMEGIVVPVPLMGIP